MRAVAASVGVLLLGAGLLAAGWLLVARGPFVPRLGPRVERWPGDVALAALLNEGAQGAGGAEARARPAVVSSERADSTGLSRVSFGFGPGTHLECTVPANTPLAVLRRYADFAARGVISEECTSYDGSEIAVHEVNGDARPVCPGQYASLADQQLHNALFLPALSQGVHVGDSGSGAATGGGSGEPAGGDAEAFSVLEAPPRGSVDTWQCSADRPVNCAVTATAPVLYCGRIRRDAAFLLANGRRRPVRPHDVATSLYYYRGLSAVRDPDALTQLDCGSLTSSVYAHALVSEVLTADTYEDYLQAFFARSPLVAGSIALHELVQQRALRERWLRERLSQAFADDRAVCFEVPVMQLVSGDEAARKLERTVRLALAFPVFAPFDARDVDVVSPLLTRVHQVATAPQQPPADPLGRELYGAFAYDYRTQEPDPTTWARMRRQLQAALGALRLPRDYEKLKGFRYVAGSGDFRVSRFSQGLGYELQGYGRGAAAGVGRTLKYRFVWEEELPERIAECRRAGGTCFFRGVLGQVDALAGPGVHASRPVRGEYVSMLGLFARRHGSDLRCTRLALESLVSKPQPDLLASIYDRLQAGSQPRFGWPTEWREFGLLPSSLASSRYPEVQRGTPGSQTAACNAPLSLAYVQEQPFEPVARRLAQILAEAGFAVQLQAVPAAQAYRHAASDYEWDVLLAVANYYTNRNLRTLLSLLKAGSRNNLAQGEVLADAQEVCTWMRYEATLVDPQPPWMHLATGCADEARPDFLAALHSVEASVHAGPAPILPLLYFEPTALKMPASAPQSAQDPYLYARILHASARSAEAQPTGGPR